MERELIIGILFTLGCVISLFLILIALAINSVSKRVEAIYYGLRELAPNKSLADKQIVTIIPLIGQAYNKEISPDCNGWFMENGNAYLFIHGITPIYKEKESMPLDASKILR